jgi:HPt (histidine-containing phosphotransfer) domain-containing protein
MDQEILSPAAAAQYIVRRHQDLTRCRKALQDNEFEVMETIGHNLKGNGVSFGHPTLSIIGEKLENSAKEKNFFECSAYIQQLEDFLHQL